MKDRIKGYALMLVAFIAICCVWPTFGVYVIAIILAVGFLLFIAACMLGFTGLLAKAGALVFGEVWLARYLARKKPYDKPVKGQIDPNQIKKNIDDLLKDHATAATKE